MSENWKSVCNVNDVPPDGGTCVLLDGMQVAIFNFAREGRWFATQNRCPHWDEQALSRGLLADHGGKPSVACPFHKRSFSLETGVCESGDVAAIQVFPVRIEGDQVYLNFTPAAAAG